MKGIVVAPQPRAAEGGARILERGGTAFDAAIAAAFVQMVVDPFMCGVGGMGTAQVYVARTGEHRMIDFYNRAGSRVTPDMWAADIEGRTAISGYTIFEDFRSELGYTSIMTPGTVAGFAELHCRYATWPWKELLGPAIATAREGFRVPPYLTDFLTRKPQQGMPDGYRRVTTTPACARIYLRPDGSLIQEGDLLRNPDMAQTLQTLAEEGPDAFYTGALGDPVAEDLAANGSFVTGEDLVAYRIREGQPLTTSYRGYTVASNPPPGGGAWVLEVLNILEGFPLGEMEHNGPEHLHLLAMAMKLAHADRDTYLGDQEFVEVPIQEVFQSKERAQEYQRVIRAGTVPASGVSAKGASETTHLTVVDQEGNVVSVTHSLGTSSGVVTPGLGFMYNDSMKLFDPLPGRPNSMASGKARTSGMCPTIVFKDGQPVLAVGAPGGSVIMSAVLQSICNVIDFGMTATEAVSAPRIHTEGGPVYVEARIREDTCQELRRRGHEVEHLVHSYAPDFSRPQMVRLLDRERLDGGSDPRSGGGVVYARQSVG